MQQNSQTKISKKESNKYNKTKEESKNKKKKDESSDDDDNSFYTDDEEDDINVHEYRKMLQQIFPSKHLDKKIKAGEQLKKTLKKLKKDEEDEDEEEEEEKPKKRIKTQIIQNNKQKKKEEEEEEKKDKSKKRIKTQIIQNNKQKKTKREEEEEEDDDEEEELGSEDSDSSSDYVDEDEEEDEEEKKNKLGKFNIILTIGKDKNDDEFEDMINEEWETCSGSTSNSGSNTENEDEILNKKPFSNFLNDISNLKNTSDYLPIVNGCLNAVLIIVFLVFNGFFGSAILKKWYTKFQLSAVLVDTLKLVIGIILTRFFYKYLFNEFSIWKFTGLAIIIQLIHDLLFYLFFHSMPRGYNVMLDFFNDYSKEIGIGDILGDIIMMILACLLSSHFATYDSMSNTIVLTILLYFSPYLLNL